MSLAISFSIDLHQHMALPLSSHESVDKNLMNHGQLGEGSHILENAMKKIRNGHDHVIWFLANVREVLDQYWGSIDFQNKSSIGKANRVIDKGASTYCGRSISTVTHYEKMVKELQQLPSAWEVVENNKKIKD
ncbi:hypothetical protein CR513_53624, partial [Mucuna pruriens]